MVSAGVGGILSRESEFIGSACNATGTVPRAKIRSVGMNLNGGQKIFIRLRPAFDKNSFLPLEQSLIGTLLHEFTHNVHASHNKDFYAFLDKLQDEYDALRVGGYTGEGFMSDGKKMGVSHNLPAHLAKAKALEEAERRSKLAKIMGPAGGRTLGGVKPLMGRSPRELMAEAAERRARDAKSCGHGEGVRNETVVEEMRRAEEHSQSVSGINLEDESTAENLKEWRLTDAETASDSGSSDIELVAGPSIPKIQPRKNISATVLGKRPIPPSPSSATHPKNIPLYQCWTCQACTFKNTMTLAVLCKMCGTERGGNAGWNLSDVVSDEHGGLHGSRGLRAPTNGWQVVFSHQGHVI